jgi:K+-transporting ATPase ATPase C chain
LKTETIMKTLFRPALTLFVLLSIITGMVYPMVATGIAQAIFPKAANGSLIIKNGKPVGSKLIGQNFVNPGYFWGRPSATSPQPYNGIASGGSNQGPLNPALTDAVKGRIEALHAADPANMLPIPVDLVTASASGLDPEISLAAARYQASRIAKVRNLSPENVASLIDAHAQGRQWGIFGEARVNVLQLNMALDELSGK